ncbi:MAG: alpha-galactosidase, partial [Oscillospiraceae bacterium]
RIYKDLEGITINGEYTAFDLFTKKGEYDEIFDSYFEAMNIKPLTDKKIKGYTSWYNYYQNINEEVILRDLDALCSKANGLFDTFQIDDGYQVAVGEWLNVDKKKFPNGMKPIAQAIHKNNLQAGIWLAPFGIQHNSQLVKQHPDWLICNEKGKPICVGGNWGGFYAVDIYNEEVRDYIKKFFNVILNEWGYDLVKLDFLYAAAILPRNNKTRGEIMYDAIDLIREAVGDNKKILGCGVQMMPCFGKVEYMRIGADMSLNWKNSLSRKMMHREDVSTINALNNSIYRRHLNERAFLCDPDVFLIRDYNVKFTFEQRKLLAKFIKIFGGVIFTSDDVNRYNK